MRMLALTLLALGGLALAMPGSALACPGNVSASTGKTPTLASADGKGTPLMTPRTVKPGN
ncbi:hypothetical protein [Marinivivus vitaminiproducens]|uniref:hypothetical protein n=1 Tax=Marinivivus vitaminiproducens TaxID=3035935 RepID=UPI00279D612D|nr:hypothetical protein P4R82_07875 [Geminicoccaceae bacterium SCSIO 64248]